MITTQFGVPIRRVRSDNGRDISIKILLLSSKMKELSMNPLVFSHPTKWDSRKKNRYILNVTHTLLFPNNVSKYFWGEAVLTTAYLISCVPSKVLRNKSPVQMLSEFYPDFLKHCKVLPRTFGRVAFGHIHNQNRSTLDPRAVRCIFIGYFLTLKRVINAFIPCPARSSP